MMNWFLTLSSKDFCNDNEGIYSLVMCVITEDISNLYASGFVMDGFNEQRLNAAPHNIDKGWHRACGLSHVSQHHLTNQKKK